MIDQFVSKGWVPDFALRLGIRHFLGLRLKDERQMTPELEDKKRMQVIEEFQNSKIAIETDKANDQHYQVPSDFFLKVLGPRLKYSCCLFEEGDDLKTAEERMLSLTFERAELKDGMDILELGCGWGSITLSMAQRFPNSKIIAVSNSKTQKAFIDQRAKEMGLTNVEVRTHDVAQLTLHEKFDRVISIEMFEHMRNYDQLLKNINGWLNPGGKLFVHIFVHAHFPYKYEVKDQTDWMTKYFFSGGTMPSEHLLYYFNQDMVVKQHWRVNGEHYAKTSAAWLANMDSQKSAIMEVFNKHYGKSDAVKWWNYWRIFFLACEEIWRFNHGREWYVCHYLFDKRL